MDREEFGELRFADTAFLTLAGQARNELQKRIKKLSTAKAPIMLRQARNCRFLNPISRGCIAASEGIGGARAVEHARTRH